jgi:hypothetical protein
MVVYVQHSETSQALAVKIGGVHGDSRRGNPCARHCAERKIPSVERSRSHLLTSQRRALAEEEV